MSDVPATHRAAGPSAVRCAVITVSDTRDLDTDTSGKLAVELLQACGHVVDTRLVVVDEPARIREAVLTQAAKPEVETILLSGGTGVSPRDQTPETIGRLLERELPGFGELFRMLSFEEIGAAAMLSRAIGGVGPHGTLIFALPGSSGAVRLGLEKLIAPELGHLLQISRTRASG